MATEVGTVLSVEDLLARSKAAAATKSPAGGSKIQQMLAGREESDTVDLSPVARLLQKSAPDKAKQTPYTEQDWYINAKVAQLKAQIYTYSNMPGLDPSGAVMDSLTKQVNDLVTKQQQKLKASQEEGAKKQAELDALEKAKADAPMSADDMLKRAKDRANGITPSTPISKEAQALLDKSKGSLVNKSA